MKNSSNKTRNPANIAAGRNLKYFMECNNITPQQLADKFGVEPDTVLRMLNGTNGISGPYNRILLEEFNCDLNFIYGGVARSNYLEIEIGRSKENDSKEKLKQSITRAMYYLLDRLESLD